MTPPPASSVPTRRRRRCFRAALVLGVLTTAVLGVELALRICWQPPQLFRVFDTVSLWREPEPGSFEPRPGIVATIEEAPAQDALPSARFEPGIIEVGFNSMGLPLPELGAKSAGERRILFGGDSLTIGHRVPLSASFPMVAADRLNQRGIRALACNAGVHGYGFVETCKRLRRFRDCTEADLLVAAYFLGNDFLDDIQQRSLVVVAGRKFEGELGNLLRQSWRARMCVRSRLALWTEVFLVENKPEWSLWQWLQPLPEQSALLAMLPTGRTAGGLFLDAPRDHVFAGAQGACVAAWLQGVEDSLRMLQRDAGQLPVLVVLLPTQYHLDARLRTSLLAEMRLDPAALELGSAQRQFRDLCARLVLPCLDATEALAAAGPPIGLYMLDHLHLSLRGNEVVAEAVADRLAKMLP
jgi:hypothetical protein